MRQVTVDQIMKWGLCYSRKMVEDLFGRRKRLSVEQIASLKISQDDRVWTLLRYVAQDAADALTDRDLRRLCMVELKWLIARLVKYTQKDAPRPVPLPKAQRRKR